VTTEPEEQASATPSVRETVTQLLQELSGGDQQALNRLVPLVYEQLRTLASRFLRSERPDHTLRATALVHEAYMHLVNADLTWQDRRHFYAVAARVMRRILVDHARSQKRQKRGGGGRADTA
jgi:RNA polymerase sigma factor (TIGR02999 family)